jgi:hypothetical protein
MDQAPCWDGLLLFTLRAQRIDLVGVDMDGWCPLSTTDNLTTWRHVCSTLVCVRYNAMNALRTAGVKPIIPTETFVGVRGIVLAPFIMWLLISVLSIFGMVSRCVTQAVRRIEVLREGKVW